MIQPAPDQAFKFTIMMQSCGLSLSQASEYLCKPLEDIKAYLKGAKPLPSSVFLNLLHLSNFIDRESARILDEIEEIYMDQGNIPKTFSLLYAQSDEDARYFKFPSLSAYNAVLRRVLEQIDYNTAFDLKTLPRSREHTDIIQIG